MWFYLIFSLTMPMNAHKTQCIMSMFINTQIIVRHNKNLRILDPL